MVSDLVSKAREAEDELMVFYGWQPFTLDNVYGRIALLVHKLYTSDNEVFKKLGEKIGVIKQHLAKVVFYANEVWLSCSWLTEIAEEVSWDMKCSDDMKLGVGVDEAINVMNEELKNLDEAYNGCVKYIRSSEFISSLTLADINKMLDKLVLSSMPGYSELRDVFDWMALNYADMAYLRGRVGEVYEMLKSRLTAIRDELSKMGQQAKEEKKEGDK
jgi:hypothetical protein